MPKTSLSLCVFCGSQPGNDPAYLAAARELGRALAERQIELVYGGGSVGMMGAIADACIEAGGEVTGVITHLLWDSEVGHRGITRMEKLETMLERKTRMAELSDGFVSLPGGVGTLDELFEMLTWSRLHIHQKPNAILNVAGYYDQLISFTQKTQVEGGFISEEDANNLIVADSVDELFSLILPQIQ